MMLITLTARFAKLKLERNFMSQSLTLLSQLLPEKIDFYHMGEVRLEPPRAQLALSAQDLDLRNRTAISFTLRGELQAAVVLLVRNDLDISMYSELGNIITSQLVTRLSDEKEIDDVLSAPRIIEAEKLEFLTLLSSAAICRKYVHFFQGQTTSIDLIIYVHTPHNYKDIASPEAGKSGTDRDFHLRSDA